jgi:hypothetical protein
VVRYSDGHEEFVSPDYIKLTKDAPLSMSLSTRSNSSKDKYDSSNLLVDSPINRDDYLNNSNHSNNSTISSRSSSINLPLNNSVGFDYKEVDTPEKIDNNNNNNNNDNNNNNNNNNNSRNDDVERVNADDIDRVPDIRIDDDKLSINDLARSPEPVRGSSNYKERGGNDDKEGDNSGNDIDNNKDNDNNNYNFSSSNMNSIKSKYSDSRSSFSSTNSSIASHSNNYELKGSAKFHHHQRLADDLVIRMTKLLKKF